MNINGKNIPFSFSQNRLYNDCPRKYKFRYIDNIVEPTNDNLKLGSAIHKYFECLNDILYNYAFNENNYALDIHKFVLEYSEFSTKSSDYFAAYNTIISMKTKDYLDKLTSGWLEWRKLRNITNTETRFEYDDFVAIFDVISQHDGRFTISDYKVTKKPKTFTSIYSEGQLLLYKYIYSKSLSIPPDMIDIEYVNIKTFVAPDIVSIVKDNPDIQTCENVWNNVNKTKQKILAGDFPKKTKYCNWCYYKDMCTNEE